MKLFLIKNEKDLVFFFFFLKECRFFLKKIYKFGPMVWNLVPMV